jgi:hypothetical protein
MELSEEHKEQIETIKSETACRHDFRCCKSSDFQKPTVWKLAGLLECLEPDAAECPHSFSFGYGWLCRCPLNRYLHNLGKNKAVY